MVDNKQLPEYLVDKIRRIKIVVIGDGGVGKTRLILNYLLNKFTDDYSMTIEDKFSKTIEIDNQSVTLEIWDSAGDGYLPLREKKLCKCRYNFTLFFHTVATIF